MLSNLHKEALVFFVITFYLGLEVTTIIALRHKECFKVENKIRDSCFTFNNTPVTFSVAEKRCESAGGQMAIIQNEATWELLIQKFLLGHKQHVWLGYKVVPNPPRLIPNIDLSNMSKYWSSIALVGSDVGKCVYSAFHVSRRWGLSECEKYSYGYFCQYFPTCQISRIKDPNVVIQSCFTSNTIPNDIPVKVDCSFGYYLNTSCTIYCRNGFWDQQVQCVPGCPPPGRKRHAELTLDKIQYATGEKIYYVCEDNYYNWKNHNKTHFSITCQEDSTWSDEDSGCSLRSDVRTSAVNINILKCDLNATATDKMWFRNGDITKLYSAINVSSSGDLVINSTFGYNNGYYVCSGTVNGKLQIGSTGYERMIWDECDIDEQFLKTRELSGTEGENLLVNCPQFYNDHNVKWFKDDEEIISSDRRNLVSGFGLFLKNVTLHDEGIYKCQRSFKNPKLSCKYNLTYSILITSSAENICGTTDIKHQNQQPWIAVLCRDDEISPFCYGTLINKQWIITSASCLSTLQRKKNLDGVYVEVGPREDTQRYEVEIITGHPEYVSRRTENDIGLIQIERSIKFTKNILPVCITAEDIGSINNCEHRSKLAGVVPGWGSFDEIGKRRLNIEKFGVVPKQICRNSNSFGFAEDKFCAKFVGDNGTFAGSDGSPFLVSFKGRQHLLGVLTWGERKLGVENYDYFTSVYYHFNWIKEVIGR